MAGVTQELQFPFIRLNRIKFYFFRICFVHDAYSAAVRKWQWCHGMAVQPRITDTDERKCNAGNQLFLFFGSGSLVSVFSVKWGWFSFESQ